MTTDLSGQLASVFGSFFGSAIVQLVLYPGALLLALVYAEEIEDVLLIADADTRLAMRGWRLDIPHSSQKRAILAQQDDGTAAHGSHPIPGGCHALDSTGERQRPGCCGRRSGKTHEKDHEMRDEALT